MLTRKKALQDAKIRYDVLKGKITIIIEGNKFGFRHELRSMTMNEYGKMCELGYIMSIFKFTKEELEEINPLQESEDKWNKKES